MSCPVNLDTVFSALADPTRRAILTQLARGEASVMELARPFEMTQPAVSQHLKVLEEAGLVASRTDGARRPRRLVKPGIEVMEEWMEQLRTALEANYRRLDAVLPEIEASNTNKGRGKRR